MKVRPIAVHTITHIPLRSSSAARNRRARDPTLRRAHTARLRSSPQTEASYSSAASASASRADASASCLRALCGQRITKRLRRAVQRQREKRRIHNRLPLLTKPQPSRRLRIHSVRNRRHAPTPDKRRRSSPLCRRELSLGPCSSHGAIPASVRPTASRCVTLRRSSSCPGAASTGISAAAFPPQRAVRHRRRAARSSNPNADRRTSTSRALASRALSATPPALRAPTTAHAATTQRRLLQPSY